MHISNLYTTGFKQRNRDHFAAIVRIALADGVITDEEQAFINRTAINLEIEEEEVKTEEEATEEVLIAEKEEVKNEEEFDWF